MQIWINWLVFFLCRQQDEGLFPCTHKEYTSLRLLHLTYAFCNTKATPNYLQNLSIKDANDYFKNIPTLCVRIWKNGNGPFLVRAPPKYLMLQVHYWVRHGFFSKIVPSLRGALSLLFTNKCKKFWIPFQQCKATW